MGLKLFVKENISFILFELIVVLFILSLYWLDGFRNLDTAIYSVIISLLLTFSYLAIRYVFRKNFLERISNMPNSMDDALQKMQKHQSIYKQKPISKNCIDCIKMKFKIYMQPKIDKKSF